MKNIVTIGGGTGSFTLLSGLKNYPVNISAIVTMADDGGSTGVLRDELGVLPPGDVRQCLVALSDSSLTLRKLMNYRFERGGLKGHNFGNLLLSALEKIEGSFSDGLDEAAKILNIKGRVIPVSDKKMHLHIRMNNGVVLNGENELDHNKDLRKHGVKEVILKPKVRASQKAISAIKRADIIVIGPGDFYGSILPNLLTDGITNAIYHSGAKVVYVCNLTNKKGQTDGFGVDEYVSGINKYFKKPRVDYCLIPTRMPAGDLQNKYEKQEGKGSVVDFFYLKTDDREYDIVRARILKRFSIKEKSRRKKPSESFIRHDSERLAKAVIEIMEMEEGRVVKEVV